MNATISHKNEIKTICTSKPCACVNSVKLHTEGKLENIVLLKFEQQILTLKITLTSYTIDAGKFD